MKLYVDTLSNSFVLGYTNLMRVQSIVGNYNSSNTDPTVTILNTLATIAHVHQVDTRIMVSEARQAGDAGADWQKRVCRLADRLEKLGGSI